MSSGFWHLKKKVGVCLCFFYGVAGLGKERVVFGINQQGRNG